MNEEELDKCWQIYNNAREDYSQALEEYQEQYGEEARERYEEEHLL